MKKLPFIFAYLILVLLWCVLFYQFIAPVKETQLILLLSAGTLFYSLIWGIFVSLFQRMIGWKGYGMLLIPIAIMIVFFLGIPKSNFLFIGGLIIISELISLAKIYSYNRS
jgi:flagellar biosynthesis protein FliQ